MKTSWSESVIVEEFVCFVISRVRVKSHHRTFFFNSFFRQIIKYDLPDSF